MAYPAVEVGSPEWWLGRLMQRLSHRQRRFDKLENYVTGNHPLPDGDSRYVRALRDLQKKAKTNYVGLVHKAVIQRMRVKEFKFQGEVDEDATNFWRKNNMELQSAIAISDAAKFGVSYMLVTEPDEDSEDGVPVLTVENPRNCIVEHDPVRKLKRLAGLKIYVDDIIERVVAILYLPDSTHIYYGPHPGDRLEWDDLALHANRIKQAGSAAAGYDTGETFPNELGEVQLVEGVWQPHNGMAECEDGGFEVQDRINHTILSRLIITKSQAYRQRMVTGARIPEKGPNQGKMPFDPGADMVWVIDDPQARVFDLEQADIKDLLEAIRDDIGDLAALTQTPVTYLTNRMVNVSGNAMAMAQHSHVAKVRTRMDSMGWYFENIIKLCFKHLDDSRASEVNAEVRWEDPEVRTMQEIAELAAKLNGIVPMELIMEWLGFDHDEIQRSVELIEEQREIEQQRNMDLAEKQAAIRAAGSRNPGSSPSGGGSSGSSSSGSSSTGGTAGQPKPKPQQ